MEVTYAEGSNKAEVTYGGGVDELSLMVTKLVKLDWTSALITTTLRSFRFI